MDIVVQGPDFGHTVAKSLILCGPCSNPNPHEKHGQGTHSTKMGADKLLENTQMLQNLSTQIVSQKPKSLDFDEKKLHWASVVRAIRHVRMLVTKHSIWYEYLSDRRILLSMNIKLVKSFYFIIFLKSLHVGRRLFFILNFLFPTQRNLKKRNLDHF